MGACEGDGSLQAGQALALIGPDVGSEAEALGGVFEIDGRDVASITLDHTEWGVDRRRWAFPTGREADGALGVAPADRAETIGIGMPQGVEACARAALGTP